MSASSLLRVFMALGFAALFGVCVRADEFATGFDEANRFYEQGNYNEAIARYDQLLRHKRSAALHFNLGNALFKAGHVGRAIAQYRLAARISPRDPDIAANLRFARESGTSGEAMRANWRQWLHRLTLTELTIATVLALWAVLSLLAVGQWRPAWRPSLRPLLMACGIVAGVAALWLAVVAYDRLGNRFAVVTAKEIVVRYGPVAESPVAFPLHDGAEVTLRGNKDGWLQIRDAKGRVGWVRRGDVLEIGERGSVES